MTNKYQKELGEAGLSNATSEEQLEFIDNLETQKILHRWKYPDGKNHVNFKFWKEDR
jgi:hypothetical protein